MNAARARPVAARSTAPVALSLCLYGVEVDASPPGEVPFWERLPAYARFVRVLDANTDVVLPEDAAAVDAAAQPAQLGALATLPLLCLLYTSPSPRD